MTFSGMDGFVRRRLRAILRNRRSGLAWDVVEMIISAGQINSSLPRGCSPWLQPGSWRANPDEETTDRRAVCGRTARTVRRAGTAKAVSDPYRKRSCADAHRPPEARGKSMRQKFFFRFLGFQSDNPKSKTCTELCRRIEKRKLVGVFALAVAFALCGASGRRAAARENLPHRFPGSKHCFR